ncbi:MBL fold metallo-hydrolase [Phenylobacterium sp.]|uniref:MBL fold metallo-hydrolase n=1 Tax=Phenylobacterium sp. TaxID=1871053 RepID=UPI0025E48D06|nr:MBL fold metallo-hydrolase [Phenylobacterium sp.]
MRHAALAMLFALAALPAFAQPPVEQVRPVAPGVWMIASAFPPHRQPDGTTIIFRAPKGLVVMDTGRHPWRRRTILDFAEAQRRPIVAIVNSHWHLDHVSGDPALKAAYPKARLYASGAIDEALTGFLAKSAADAAPYLAPGKLPPETQEDIRGDIATTANGAALKPDIVIEGSSLRDLGGLSLQVNLARDAATAGDVWLYDPKTRVAAVGDLVTLPAPFLDTACPKGWAAALDQVAATPFTTLIPGHGAPMSRAQFDLYRTAFNEVVACAASSRDKAECAAAWTKAVTPLLGEDPALAKRAQGMTEYYVADVLRAHGGKSAYCTTG